MSPPAKRPRPRPQPLKVLKATSKAKHLQKVREGKRVCFAGDSVSCLVHAKASVLLNRDYGCVTKPRSTIVDTLRQVKVLKKSFILVVFVGPNQIDGLLADMDDFSKLLAQLNLLYDQYGTKTYLALIPRNEGKETVIVKGKKMVVSGSLRQRLCRSEFHSANIHFMQTAVHAEDYNDGDILHPSDAKIEEFVDELVSRGIIR